MITQIIWKHFFCVKDVSAIGKLVPRQLICVISTFTKSTLWRRSNYTKEFLPESPVQQMSCAIGKYFQNHNMCVCVIMWGPIVFYSIAGKIWCLCPIAAYLGHPKPQKLAEMKFWYFSHRSRDKTWSDKLGGIWGEILVGRSAQWMKHGNAQKISPKISPNFSPNSSPRISPGQKFSSSQCRSGECQA